MRNCGSSAYPVSSPTPTTRHYYISQTHPLLLCKKINTFIAYHTHLWDLIRVCHFLNWVTAPGSSINHSQTKRVCLLHHFVNWVTLFWSQKMKVSVVSRSGKDVVKGDLVLSDSVRSSLSLFSFVFVIY